MAVYFVGPLPPPVHGFSNINAAVLARLQQRGPVVVFDRAPPRWLKGWPRRAAAVGEWAWQVLTFATRVAAGRHGTALYLCLSGGRGQFMDWPFLWLAHRVSLRTFVHHHSYAYLNTSSLLTARLLRAAPDAEHIVLCDDMKTALSTTYDLPATQIRSLSNAAFMARPVVAAGGPPTADLASPPVVVGFLSNITAEKGIFEFFDIVRTARERGLPVRALIAGPVDPSVRAEFDAALEREPGARHLGPVYGDRKTEFLCGIDVLLFPTKYLNEAEPVTIHEALAHGAAVVAATRGCIGGILPAGSGVAKPLNQLPEAAYTYIASRAAMDVSGRSELRMRIQADHLQVVAEHQHRLTQLMHDIQP